MLSGINLVSPVYRPPSEAYSLLLQITLGCSNNQCTYCAMYQTKKYRVRPLPEILQEVEFLKAQFGNAIWSSGKVFFCDGDALGAPMDVLVPVLEKFNECFPNVRRFGVYATAANILEKTLSDLKQLADLGLGMAYLGMESGSDEVLSLVRKGNTAQEMVEAGKKIIDAGWKLSVIAMLGLGGRALSQRHCADTGRVVTEIAPHFFSFLTTVPVPKTAYARAVERGDVELLTTKELLVEMRSILEGVFPTRRSIVFRANHVSNMYPLGGVLPKDSGTILAQLEEWIIRCPEGVYPDISPHHL